MSDTLTVQPIAETLVVTPSNVTLTVQPTGETLAITEGAVIQTLTITDNVKLPLSTDKQTYLIYNPAMSRLELWVTGVMQQAWSN